MGADPGRERGRGGRDRDGRGAAQPAPGRAPAARAGGAAPAAGPGRGVGNGNCAPTRPSCRTPWRPARWTPRSRPCASWAGRSRRPSSTATSTPGTSCAPTVSRGWPSIPRGTSASRAYDGGTLLKSRVLALIEADDLSKAVHRTLDVFSEAAELDRERVRRWAQLHAVQAAFHGRRHGFRMARTGDGAGLGHRVRGGPGGPADVATRRRSGRNPATFPCGAATLLRSDPPHGEVRP